MATVKRTWLQDPYKNDVNFWTNVVSVQTGLLTSSKALEKFKGCRIKCALGQTQNHQEFSFFLKNVGSRLRASCSEVNDYFSSNTNVGLKMELYWFLASIQLLIWFPPSQTFETKSGKFKLDVSWNSFVFPVIVAVSSKRNHLSTFNKWKKVVHNRKQIKKRQKPSINHLHVLTSPFDNWAKTWQFLSGFCQFDQTRILTRAFISLPHSSPHPTLSRDPVICGVLWGVK